MTVNSPLFVKWWGAPSSTDQFIKFRCGLSLTRQCTVDTLLCASDATGGRLSSVIIYTQQIFIFDPAVWSEHVQDVYSQGCWCSCITDSHQQTLLNYLTWILIWPKMFFSIFFTSKIMMKMKLKYKPTINVLDIENVVMSVSCCHDDFQKAEIKRVSAC